MDSFKKIKTELPRKKKNGREGFIILPLSRVGEVVALANVESVQGG